LKYGQKVNVTYEEIYRSTYKDVDGDGKKDLVSKVSAGYKFLDANPKE